MNNIIKMTAEQAGQMAAVLNLIKAEKAVLSLNIQKNGKYMQNSIVLANKEEQIQAICFSIASSDEAEKTELVVETGSFIDSLDILKAVGADIEIRKADVGYYFYIEGAVPSVPIKVLTEKPEISMPDQSTLAGQYSFTAKDLAIKLAESDRTDPTSSAEIAKSMTLQMAEGGINIASTDGISIGRAEIAAKTASVASAKTVGVPSKYIATVRKVCSLAETVSLAVFESNICLGSGAVVYVAPLSTAVIPPHMLRNAVVWRDGEYAARFTCDSEKLTSLINVLRIGATSDKKKPVVVFTGEDSKVNMRSFDGSAVILPCSKVEGKIDKCGLNSQLLEKMVKQLKRGNITISIAEDLGLPCLFSNGTIDEPVKDSILFLMKTNLQAAEKEAHEESSESAEENEAEE